MEPLQAFLDARLARVRSHLDALDADALLVTHLPNVVWLSGFPGTSAALFLTRELLHLVTDGRYAVAVERLASSGAFPSSVNVTITDRPLDSELVDLISAGAGETIAVEGDHLSVRRFQKLDALLPKGSTLVPVDAFLERQRALKDAGEVHLYREATARLAEVAAAVPRLLETGRTEQEIAADIDHAMKRGGFQRAAFDTIVASGPNSALPHARPGARRLTEGDPVVLDFGGVYGGYCVDLTRTAFVGHPTEKFLALFDAVNAANHAAVAAVRDGVRASEIDAAARDVLAGRGFGDAFVHATGHGLGLEVHEYPRIGRQPPDGDDPVVRAGMIFTIEPGAYVPDLGGVRIEDDVLVGPRGAEVLTDIPRGLMIPGAR